MEVQDVLRMFGEGEDLVILIGRGHNGTRAGAQLMKAGGTHLGRPLNGSQDLVPRPNRMYNAARMGGGRVRVDRGEQLVNADELFHSSPPPNFTAAVARYMMDGGLHTAIQTQGIRRVGWKLPETVLCFPWIGQMFPRAAFIMWGRDPRGAIRESHGTDDLSVWGVQGWPADIHNGAERAMSHAVQTWLLLNTPRSVLPARLYWTSLERWCQDEAGERQRMEHRLEVPFGFVAPRMNVLRKWAQSDSPVGRGTPELKWALEMWDAWQDREVSQFAIGGEIEPPPVGESSPVAS